MTGPRPEALAAVTEAVRLVEDAIDATSDRVVASGGGRLAVTTVRTGLAVVEALVEAGWTPPDLVSLAIDALDEPGP